MESLAKKWLLVCNSAQKKICQFHFSKPEGWIFKFDLMVFSERYIGRAKKCATSLMFWHWKAMESLGEKRLLVSNSAQRKICQFRSSEPEGPNFKFDEMVFSERYLGWAKNFGTSVMLWHWRAMESLGENWLLVSNWAQEKICEFYSSEPECQNFNFGEIVFCKRYIAWAKNYGSSLI